MGSKMGSKMESARFEYRLWHYQFIFALVYAHASPIRQNVVPLQERTASVLVHWPILVYCC